MALFVANAVELKIGQKTLLENVSFEIPPNKIIAIVGQNGSGKSSFLKVLAGLLDIDGGKTQITKGVRIGYLAQDFELGENLTSEEILQKYAQNDLGFNFDQNYKTTHTEKLEIQNKNSKTQEKITKDFQNLDSQKQNLDSDLIIKIAEIQEKIKNILIQFQINL
jgi:ATPase subunit of ABC transporter with duplicated ATPase domains